jgi:hypothetical protein
MASQDINVAERFYPRICHVYRGLASCGEHSGRDLVPRRFIDAKSDKEFSS